METKEKEKEEVGKNNIVFGISRLLWYGKIEKYEKL